MVNGLRANPAVRLTAGTRQVYFFNQKSPKHNRCFGL